MQLGIDFGRIENGGQLAAWTVRRARAPQPATSTPRVLVHGDCRYPFVAPRRGRIAGSNDAAWHPT